MVRSSSSSGSVTEDELAVDVQALLKVMETDLGVTRTEFKVYDPSSIFRVVAYDKGIDTDNNEQYYHPKIISIGPLHRETENLKEMEIFKHRYLDDLLNRVCNEQRQKRDVLEGLYNAVETTLEDVLEKYYEKVCDSSSSENNNNASLLNKNEFIKMLIYDGCFIVEFLLKWYSDDIHGHLAVAPWSMLLLRNDLLLLENQVPYFVLHSLYYTIGSVGPEFPNIFIDLAMSYLLERKVRVNNEEDVQIHHLLHLYHFSINPKFYQSRDEISEESCCTPLSCQIWKIFLYPLRWIWKNMIKPSLAWLVGKHSRISKGAVDNMEAGLTFQKKRGNHSFLDVEFEDGTLTFPTLTIDHSKITSLLNLLAFETCSTPRNSNDQNSTTTTPTPTGPQNPPTATATPTPTPTEPQNPPTPTPTPTPTEPQNPPTPTGFQNPPTPHMINETVSITKTTEKFVTPYIALMDKLIDTSEDVNLLQRLRIIDNQLCEYEQLAAIFNKLGNGVPKKLNTANNRNNEKLYGEKIDEVMMKMDAYCQERVHGWRATLENNHFSNPWAVIGLVAGIILFVLTIVQTHYTIYPSK